MDPKMLATVAAAQGPQQGGGGGDILQQIMQLAGPILQSPQGQAMAQAIMSQLSGGGGSDPRARMAQGGYPRGPEKMPFMPMGAEGQDSTGPATDMELEDMSMAAQGMRPDPPPDDRDMMGKRANMSDPRQTPMPMSTEDELAMAQKGMGGPTQEDIQMLLSDPSPTVIRSFAQKFGADAVREILGGKGGGKQMPPGRDKDYEAEEGDGDADDE